MHAYQFCQYFISFFNRFLFMQQNNFDIIKNSRKNKIFNKIKKKIMKFISYGVI